jgi:hypothetical protein
MEKLNQASATSGIAEKEENCMKLDPVFVVAAVIVACLKGIRRDSKDESASSFHRLVYE